MNLDEQIQYIESVRHENRSGEAHSILASLRELKRLRESMTMHANWMHAGATGEGLDPERCAAMERSMWDALGESTDGQ